MFMKLNSSFIHFQILRYNYLIRAKNLIDKEGYVHLALGGVYTLIVGERNSNIEVVPY